MNNGVTNNTNNQINNVPAPPVADSGGVISGVQQQNVVQTGVSQTPIPASNVPQTQNPTPQIIQSVPTENQSTSGQQNILPQDQNNVTQSANGNENNHKEKKARSKINITPFLVFGIIILVFLLVYSQKSNQEKIENIKYSCTPITASKEEIKLDLNSTLVKDLYSRVVTTLREDLAQPEFNDNMRLYLAYRQILETDKYDSNCNLFSNLAMEPYKCNEKDNFTPKAFKEETLQQALKKMYGDGTEIKLDNIRLGTSCIGGYQYIPQRGEFVQGSCEQQSSTSFRVTKTLKEATSRRNTIILTEDVTYHGGEKLALPEFLKNGLYYYTFRLDMNYNYVLVSKTYESKY